MGTTTIIKSIGYIGYGTTQSNQYYSPGSLQARTYPQKFDWIQAARTIRAKANPSPDSTPILRALRDQQSLR